MSEVSDTNPKTKVLKSEFGADMPERLLEKEVIMCNYSEFVENRGIRKELKKELKRELKRELKKELKRERLKT